MYSQYTALLGELWGEAIHSGGAAEEPEQSPMPPGSILYDQLQQEAWNTGGYKAGQPKDW